MRSPTLTSVLILSALLVQAGCISAVPGSMTSTPTSFEPHIVETFSTGGQCVEAPQVGMTLDSARADSVRTVTVEGNATVDGAHYAIEGFDLRAIEDRVYRLDINTTAGTGKPVSECAQGGIVHYRAMVEFPATAAFELQIRHDGVLVSAVGSVAES